MPVSISEGKLVVDFNQTERLTIDDVIRDHPDVTNNGEWKPPGCVSRHRVAIIIPYRDRLHHLVILLDSILRILKRQQLDFRIYVVEQVSCKYVLLCNVFYYVRFHLFECHEGLATFVVESIEVYQTFIGYKENKPLNSWCL